jgi:hypothetical protein
MGGNVAHMGDEKLILILYLKNMKLRDLSVDACHY